MAAVISMAMREDVRDVRQIPRLTHKEAGELAVVELDRVLALVESLDGDDWTQPTDCTEWNVRDMLAHLSGACAGESTWAQFKRQYFQNPYMRQAAVKVDAVNRIQVEDRAERSPAELVAELRDFGPKAIRVRQRLPWLVRHLWIPFGAPLGFKPFHYLTDTIYPRDQWMHRADICRATGRQMVLTPEHDGRMIDLVVAEIPSSLKDTLGGRTLELNLTGGITLAYRFGDSSQPDAVITIDLLEFARLTSDRSTPDEAYNNAAITGDAALVRRFLENCSVPY